jgi:hypothetical protein
MTRIAYWRRKAEPEKTMKRFAVKRWQRSSQEASKTAGMESKLAEFFCGVLNFVRSFQVMVRFMVRSLSFDGEHYRAYYPSDEDLEELSDLWTTWKWWIFLPAEPRLEQENR